VTADFTLSDHDRASGLWLRLREHLGERLASARVRNDHDTLSEQQTAALRGEIRTLKAIIRLGDDRPMTGDGDQPPD
jgi:hypothetical protein